MFEPTVARARDAGLDVRAYVSMCFGDPWEGEVPVEQVVSVGKRLFDLGACQLSLGDTIGVGTAGHVTALLAAFAEAGMAADRLALHFHDTYGQALANALRRRCRPASPRSTPPPAASAAAPTPRAPPATSPPRTWSGCSTGLGIEHGVDLDALVRHERVDGRAARPAQPVSGGPRARLRGLAADSTA